MINKIKSIKKELML